jgi:hypothetical protein
MSANFLVTENSKRGRYLKKKPLLNVLATVLYVSLILFIPWDQISRSAYLEGGFRDFNRYVGFFSSRQISLRELYGWINITQYFTGEILWDELMLRLVDITDSPEVSLRIISCFICSVWGIYTFSRVPFFWALTFLLNPISIEVALSGIRNGFGWSIFILGTTITYPVVRTLLLVSSLFIHSSSAGLLVFYYLPDFIRSSITRKLFPIVDKVKSNPILLVTLPGFTVGFMLLFGSNFLGFLNDRRISSGEDYFRGGGSFLQMSFWIILFAIQLTCNFDYIKKHTLAINILAWYIIMNFMVPWSYRLWGASIPLLAYAIWDLPRKKRQVVLPLWIGYLVLWFVYWSVLFIYGIDFFLY